MRSVRRNVDLLAATLFGGLFGALITSLIHTPTFPVNGIVTAAAAILVGWWIQSALKRRGELDRVPIDYLATLNQRIDDRVVGCIDYANSIDRKELLEKHLAPLANEVYWLQEFANRVDHDNVHRLTTKLADHYLDMKEYLTATDEIDLRSASRESHGVRLTALAVRWHVCRQILEKQPDIAVLAGD